MYWQCTVRVVVWSGHDQNRLTRLVNLNRRVLHFEHYRRTLRVTTAAQHTVSLRLLLSFNSIHWYGLSLSLFSTDHHTVRAARPYHQTHQARTSARGHLFSPYASNLFGGRLLALSPPSIVLVVIQHLILFSASVNKTVVTKEQKHVLENIQSKRDPAGNPAGMH